MAKTRRVVKAHQKRKSMKVGRKSMKSRKPRHSKKVARKTRRGRKHHGRKSSRHMRGGGMFNNVTGAFKRFGNKVTNTASGLVNNAKKTLSNPPSFENPFKKHSTPNSMKPIISSTIPSTQPKPSMRF